MEILYIILAFIFGAVLAYFIIKSSSISRNLFDDLNQKFIQLNADFKNAENKLEEVQAQLKTSQDSEIHLNSKLNSLQQEISTLTANNEMQTKQLQKNTDFEKELNEQVINLRQQN